MPEWLRLENPWVRAAVGIVLFVVGMVIAIRDLKYRNDEWWK